ncbi:MAG: hypothetical protein HA490_03665 [Archaeoglobales archaeon]|jgi:hypothetical protein|nr:hypothetical protein [Archaeoglobus sp.]NHW88734.1 hypothetical protein [Archaeoglobales archaeon]TDA25182.1 MAG: hypothetical protein DSN99_08840 [Archaeoglobi archaeon]
MNFEGIVEGYELKFKASEVEIGKGYGIFLLFIEMPNVKHHGFFIEKDGLKIAKGVIAKYVRDMNIETLEVVAPPPPDSNAVLMVRIGGEEFERVLKRIAKHICDFLKSQQFIK